MPTSSRLREVLKTPGDLKSDLHQLGIEIIAMSGRAGDVFLMDLRVLHPPPSVNSTKNDGHYSLLLPGAFALGPSASGR